MISGANGLNPGMVMKSASGLAVTKSAPDTQPGSGIRDSRPPTPGSRIPDIATEARPTEHPVALTGRVWCWCDATHGAIGPGDLLTTSSTPGHAMRVAPNGNAPRGCILGKAMSSLKKGRGLVLVLVQPQ